MTTSKDFMMIRRTKERLLGLEKVIKHIKNRKEKKSGRQNYFPLGDLVTFKCLDPLEPGTSHPCPCICFK